MVVTPAPNKPASTFAAFDYAAAFSRNIGWVTEAEQQTLSSKRVAIAGLGGVGGAHLLTLARLGIGRFSIADFDRFDLANFNRQAGATTATLGRPKVEVLAAQVRLINPAVELRAHEDGVTAANVNAFLAGADCYVDGLDFFAFGAREMTFAACAQLGIPAVTVAPLGMGAALLNFLPGRMTFEQYFGVSGRGDAEKAARFLVGLAPAMLARGYLVDDTRVNLSEQRGPSTIMACDLCAGIAATETLKILLRRGKVLAAPWGMHFDAYTYRLKKTWRPGGNANPLQRLLISIVRRRYRALEVDSGSRR
jgi:molybdopterin/thiamine biosynthesis adenylyltransferase